METRRFIELKNGVGLNAITVSRNSWLDAEGHPLPVPDGLVEVPQDGVDYIGCAYTAKDGFGAKAPVVERTRVISHARYFDLFTFAERTATFALIDTGDARVPDYWARVQLGGPINLLSSRVSAGLGHLKSRGVFGNDSGAANARIAAIVANHEPA